MPTFIFLGWVQMLLKQPSALWINISVSFFLNRALKHVYQFYFSIRWRYLKKKLIAYNFRKPYFLLLLILSFLCEPYWIIYIICFIIRGLKTEKQHFMESSFIFFLCRPHACLFYFSNVSPLSCLCYKKVGQYFECHLFGKALKRNYETAKCDRMLLSNPKDRTGISEIKYSSKWFLRWKVMIK